MILMVVSVPPPGADGTMIRTGLSGYSAAGDAATLEHRNMTAAMVLLTSGSSFHQSCNENRET
jgi:hypothetical protein